MRKSLAVAAIAVFVLLSSSPQRVRAQSQTPYNSTGAPWPVPGTVQAEDFDSGGEGVAYHDQDAGNNGGGYRPTDVDTWCNGVDCGIGWVGAGEWLEYTVNVTNSGIYTIEASVGAPADGGSFHIEIAGVDVTGQMFVPNTGDWRTWTTVGRTGVQLNAGQYIVRVVMDTQNAAGAVCDFNHLRFIQTSTQTPYLGTPRALPGIIQAEDFDEGGEGVAYHDLDVSNNGGGYRQTAVDTWCNGVDCGIGWIGAGEWLEYTVNVSTSGSYTVEASVGAPAFGGSFHIEVDGVNKTGTLQVPNTGDWRTWATVTKADVPLAAGQHVVRVVMDTNNAWGGVCDFNYLRFTLPQTPYHGTPSALPGTVQAEDFDNGGEGVAYHDQDAGSNGGGYRPTDVDTWCNGVDCGIGWVGAGEWLEYTVNVTSSGSYTVEASVGAPAAGGSFHIEVDGVDKTGTLQVPNTGDWRTWGTVTKTDVALSAGQHIVRVMFDTNNAWGAVCDFNYLRFTLSQTPYNSTGAPWPVPGTVQAEDFDSGGEGVAYHDQDAGNNGGGYRPTDVDTWCNGVDCGIGWIGAGEWLEYTVNVAAAGTYTLQVRAGSPGPGGTFHVEVDGADKTGPMTVPATGDWRTWGTVTKTGVQLGVGRQVIRIMMDAGGSNGGVCDLDSFTFTAEAAEYEIVARHTGKCLDVEAGSAANGAWVQQWECVGSLNQQWTLVPVGDGFYRIVAKHSGRALDILSGSYDNGARAVQWDYLGSANQQWQLVDLGNGYYQIRARHSGKALDVLGVSRDNGAQVVQWDYLGSANQQWQLRLVTPGPDPRSRTGVWSGPADWPFVPVHAHLLPNGKVLAWSGENTTQHLEGTPVWLWDPVRPDSLTNYYPGHPAFLSVDNHTINLFCSGHTLLPDGRLLVAGGHHHFEPDPYQPTGEPHTSIFDFRNNSWTQGPDMRAGRWYPTNTSLGSGEVLVTSGTVDPTNHQNRIPEVWQTNSTLRALQTAERELPNYPWMHVAPNGRVFNSGPNQNTDYLDTAGSGTWLTTSVFSNFGYRDEGSSVMYAPGKVLIAGGGAPTASTEVIDLNQSAPIWKNVREMGMARRHLNTTLLPDGTVLASGGTSYGGNDANGAAYAPEIWNPVTEQWSGLLSSMRIPRLYHSVALLLPDGRVLSGGGGVGVGTDYPNIELYSPPYLFKGARPQITDAPQSVGYSQRFFVGTPDANIARATLVRLSSVTHSYNQNQRFNDLTGSIQRVSGGVYVTSPANGGLCPPGHYMLFLLNDQGVPSVARIIQVL